MIYPSRVGPNFSDKGPERGIGKGLAYTIYIGLKLCIDPPYGTCLPSEVK